MAIPSRSAQPGTFFVTTATYQRRRLFQVTANAELLMQTLDRYRVQGSYKLYAFVIMPDHVHLILQPIRITLERAMQLIKGGFSRAIGSNFPVWQKGFTDHRLRDRADYDEHLRYTHENPLSAGMVLTAEEYCFSSAYRRIGMEDLSG